VYLPERRKRKLAECVTTDFECSIDGLSVGASKNWKQEYVIGILRP